MEFFGMAVSLAVMLGCIIALAHLDKRMSHSELQAWHLRRERSAARRRMLAQ